MKSLNRIAWIGVTACLLSLAAHAEQAETPPAGETFGAPLTLTQPTALAEVVRAPETFADRPILLRGRLADVCQKKGCWTLLEDGADRIRVRFRDYAFFLPKGSIGADAYVEGVVKVQTLSQKEARHYESEARDGDPARVQGPQREVGFTASGVRIVSRGE